MIADTLFDTRALFEAFAARAPLLADGVHVVPLALTSRHQGLLVEEDRAFTENESFHAALCVPEHGAPFRELCVLFHGLNEGTEAKLLPWAVNLARRGTPALIFPSSLHLSRRPSSFLSARGDAFAERRVVANNARVSPYNAMLSQRMATRPDRFLRGALQTYRDVVDVARALERGTFADPFAKGARMSFLGYSIGGYLAQLALLANPEGLFSESRALLFSTGAALAQVRPQTILILDVDAQDQLTRYYDNDESRAGRLPLLDELGANEGERRWLPAMLYADASLRGGLQSLGARVRGLLNTTDLVFPPEAVRDALEGIAIDDIALGLHELPFNQSTPLGESYTDREGRRLLLTVVKSYSVAEDLRPAFSRFVDVVDAHVARR